MDFIGDGLINPFNYKLWKTVINKLRLLLSPGFEQEWLEFVEKYLDSLSTYYTDLIRIYKEADLVLPKKNKVHFHQLGGTLWILLRIDALFMTTCYFQTKRNGSVTRDLASTIKKINQTSGYLKNLENFYFFNWTQKQPKSWTIVCWVRRRWCLKT